MINLKQGQVPTTSARTYANIMGDQGVTALWRGNMPKIYQNMLQTALRIMFFDRSKAFLMPYSENKYEGFDYLWRILTSATVTGGLTLFVTYPLDLIHTRMSGDLTKKGT